MRTNKFRLLATMITLAAVTTLTVFSAQAQRRSTGSQTKDSAVKKSDNSRKSTIQKKSTFKNYEKTQRNPSRTSVTQNRSTQRKSTSTVNNNKNNNTQRQKMTPSRYSEKNSSQAYNRNSSVNHKGSQSRNQQISRDRSVSPTSNTKRVYANNKRIDAKTQTRTRTSYSTTRNSTPASSRNKSVGKLNSSNKARYNLNTNDKRYRPNNDYRGNNKTWTSKNRSPKMNYSHNSNKHYGKNNFYKQKHWDRHWENYCWSHNSWRDYYHGYNPHSYTYHSHYYHHHHYGHVIRKFNYRPQMFMHNNIRYYSHNGNFFRYHWGVGYVLADLPYGMAFDYIPSGYETVHVNGYLYLRVGNLFFEYSNRGYQLVHYPERYMAYENDYQNNGYYYNDY